MSPAMTSVEKSPADPPDPAIQTLGGYRLLQKLGSGGMANVYLGHRVVAGSVQLAAVKVMLPHLVEDKHSIEMFFDEARVTAAVCHPAVSRVLDFGIDGGVPFLATEYILGEMLSDVIEILHRRHGRIAARHVMVHVIAQACEGLHAAHEACDESGRPLNIVHRDMAPQNIMIGYDGHVRVLDFGIARSADQVHETQNGVLRGRFAYMAPEQLEGGTVDRRADVWSLGVMLWEGVAGRRLFKRETMGETMRAAISDPLPPLLRSVEDMPLALRDVVERAVVRNPTLRYATARKMGHDLALQTSTTPEQLGIWMQRAFPKRFAARKSLLSTSASVDPSVLAALAEPRPISAAPTASQSGVRISSPSLLSRDTGGFPTLNDVFRGSPSSGAPPQIISTPPEEVRPPKRTKLVVAALVAGAVFGGLLGLEALLGGHSTPAAAAAPTRPSKNVHVRLGTVVVRTPDGSARVQIDGRALGTTPARFALTEGHHVVQLSSALDDLGVVTPVHVRAGETQTLDIPLTK